MQNRNNMKTIQKISTLVAIITIALLAVSCDNGIDEMNGLAKGQESQSAKIVNLTVLVNDTFEGKFLYKIEIFDANPAEGSAVLLKSGVGSRDLFFTSNVSVSEFHKTIYVRQTDPSKNQLIKTIDVTTLTGNIRVDFSK
jgi:hypothetical protein